MDDTERATTSEIRDFFARPRGLGRWPKGREHHLRERWELLMRVAGELGVDMRSLRVLDVGCGAGADLDVWRAAGVDPGRLAGTELIPERASVAGELLPGASIEVVDGVTLPFPDSTFDIVTASLVFSLIRDVSLRQRLFREMQRVARPGGRLVIYDFTVRKHTNKSVVAITSHRASELGGPPDRIWRAGPLLPALPTVLKLPRLLRNAALRVLPRTHAMYVWER